MSISLRKLRCCRTSHTWSRQAGFLRLNTGTRHPRLRGRTARPPGDSRRDRSGIPCSRRTGTPRWARPKRAGARCTNPGGVATMLEMRSSPHAGSHFTFLISSSARVRSVAAARRSLPSIEMNHCSVARKMMGLWQRQQCGYECSILSKPSNTPRLFSSSTISGFALKTCWPLYSGNPLRRMPPSSTSQCRSRPYFTPVLKSSAP